MHLPSTIHDFENINCAKNGEAAVAMNVPSGLWPKNEPDTTPSFHESCDEVHCWISFGGNVGDVKATFNAALALLSLHCFIQLGERSGLYCSTPMGTNSGSRFLNSVCGLKTRLSPHGLLCVLQSVETQLGRVREIDWGPRTLDLDLLSYGDSLIDEQRLLVPHPALSYRRFVLDPLAEVDPDWRHPVFAESTMQILNRVKTRPLQVALLNLTDDEICQLSGELVPKFPDLQLFSEAELTEKILPIRVKPTPTVCGPASIDLRRSPGDLLEQLTSAFTAIFDTPIRASDW
jgi:2-amino-4-hydroxy-6-hydroxymethyldihydropteridine diphosphokinase